MHAVCFLHQVHVGLLHLQNVLQLMHAVALLSSILLTNYFINQNFNITVLLLM